MDSLPLDILQNIFTLLTLDERTTCLRVCRTWWNVLDKYCLFYDVAIYQNEDQFKNLMKVMELSPRHAAQVAELDVFFSLPSDFNKRKLYKVFPNLRILNMDKAHTLNNNPIQHFKEPLAIIHSTPKIRILIDGGYCELASQMFYSNLCGYLERLELNFKRTSSRNRTFLSQLKYLPVLRRLRIMKLTMAISDLEDLHNNLPTLQSYFIECGTLLASEMPANIAPLSALKDFQLNIRRVENIDTHIAMYRYVSKKYINAMEGRCLDFLIDQYTPSDAKVIFDSAIFDYLRVIASKSPDFHIACVPEEINVFPIFDDIDCQFKKILANTCKSDSFIQNLVQSKQSKSTKELDLANMLLKSLDILKHFTALTTFNLTVRNKSGLPRTVNMTDYLNALPKTVTTFKVKCSSLTCVPFNTSVSSIEKFQIISDRLTKEFGDIISTCFPKLVELKLAGTVSGNVDIVLNNDSLKRVLFYGLKGHYGFSFKSGLHANPQHYLCKDYKIIASNYYDIMGLPNLSFTSFKEKKLDTYGCIEISSPKASIQSFWKYNEYHYISSINMKRLFINKTNVYNSNYDN